MAEKTPPKKKKIAPEEEKAARIESTPGEDDAILKEKVLEAALPDAVFDGFTDKVLAKAGKAAGLDQDALARLFPEGPVSLIEF
jgi:ubiquinone biosynthesis protein COQ9